MKLYDDRILQLRWGIASGLATLGLLLIPLWLTGCGEGGAANSATPATSTAPTTTAAPTATLLFASNFGPDVSLGAPRDIKTTAASPAGGGLGWQDLAGTDKETGYSWPVAALGAKFSGVQLITVDPVTSSTIGNYITAEIRQVPGPQGAPVYELFQNVKIKAPVGKGLSQAPLLITRSSSLGDVADLYVAYWFKHQADLATQLDNTVSAGNWRVQFEFKTGGYGGSDSNGDYRISTDVMKGADGTLFWRTKSDGVANGPYVGDCQHRADPTCMGFSGYWGPVDSTVPVPVDTWFHYETFWHRSSGSDGRFWAAVNGQVIVDHAGPNMGKLQLPITRIMVTNTYSGGRAPVESHVTGLEIWNGFPCGVGLSCYK